MIPSQAGRQGRFTAWRELHCLAGSSQQVEMPHSETIKPCGTLAKGSQALPSPAAQPWLPLGSLAEWERFLPAVVGPALVSYGPSKRSSLLTDEKLSPAGPCGSQGAAPHHVPPAGASLPGTQLRTGLAASTLTDVSPALPCIPIYM